MFNLFIVSLISIFCCYSTEIKNSSFSNTSNVVELDNNLSKKDAYNYNGSTFIGISEVVSYDYFQRMCENLQNYEFVYNTGVKVTDFLQGDSVNIWTSDMYLVDLNNDGSISSTTQIETINLDIDEIDTKVERFRFTLGLLNSYSVVFEGWYYFNDAEHTEFMFNTFAFRTNPQQLVYWDHTCLSFSIGTYTSLFPSGTSGGTNYNVGYQNGYSVGIHDGYQTGYVNGYNTASSTDTTASTIFTGILDVALIPVNVFLTIFNFDVFGINIAGIVSALLTVSVVIIIFRFLFGGSKDDK